MSNKHLTGIDKLRAMIAWLDWQSEYLNQSFNSIGKLEKLYDYAQDNNLEFMDNDYLYRECEKEERIKALEFISKLQKS